jgi:hypothetical protein
MYAIFYDYGTGKRDLIAITNNLDKWKVEHNKERKDHVDNPCTDCKCYEEELNDFHIEETSSYIYSKEN